MTDAKLTVRQRRFVSEFLACGTASEAARRAGYSERTARSKGYSLLRLPAVRTEIDRQEADRLAELRVTADRLDAAMAGIVFSTEALPRDRINAGRLLYDRQGLLEHRHHVTANVPGRAVIYMPHNGREPRADLLDWRALLGDRKGDPDEDGQ